MIGCKAAFRLRIKKIKFDCSQAIKKQPCFITHKIEKPQSTTKKLFKGSIFINHEINYRSTFK